ncbi:hypothetical protein ACMD2_22305 [Ananas comosus]|uniref:Uncharacterized protein n=1 Tax=Ananas comosus TaxID=4615 RepID=A0A199UDD7_ANACO|nr:hypothetical protein ACMD2_22305 [Ananas comosus]
MRNSLSEAGRPFSGSDLISGQRPMDNFLMEEKVTREVGRLCKFRHAKNDSSSSIMLMWRTLRKGRCPRGGRLAHLAQLLRPSNICSSRSHWPFTSGFLFKHSALRHLLKATALQVKNL